MKFEKKLSISLTLAKICKYSKQANLRQQSKKKRKVITRFFKRKNYKNPTPLIKILHNLQMQVLPFQDFIFCLKVVSAPESLIPSGNEAHK